MQRPSSHPIGPTYHPRVLHLTSIPYPFNGRHISRLREGHEFGLAAYYVMQDHLYEAIATLSRLGREHPDEIVVLNNLAYAYEQRGMVGDARMARNNQRML
jgi:hypothetical protein